MRLAPLRVVNGQFRSSAWYVRLTGDVPCRDFAFPFSAFISQVELYVHLAKKNRTRAIPNANAKPYPKLSICIAFLFCFRSVEPTIDIPSPARTGLMTTLRPG